MTASRFPEGQACPDCGVAVGSAHDLNCDVARCLWDGGQRLMHSLPAETLFALAPGLADQRPGEHVCGNDIWTGEWPGDAECREFGWFVKWRAPGPGEQYGAWVPTTVDDPDAVPDLNRLYTDCTWDREQGRWVLP